MAGVASFYASGHPDGLEYVAEQTGFLHTAEDSAAADSPLADYSTKGVDDARLSGGIAGVAGSLLVLALAGGLFMLLRRRGDASAVDGRPPRRPEPDVGPDMGAGHGHKLHFHGHSPSTAPPAHRKILALVGFMLVVVATPREWFAAYAAYAGVLAVVIGVSRVPPTYIAKRMVVEVPFVVFAVLMPFVATGPQIGARLLWLTVSEAGLWGAWALLVKGTLGVVASLTLAATTEPQELLRGLERLRLPSLLVQIMGFMIRYLDVVTDELGRMTVAMRSRGCDPRVAATLAGDGAVARARSSCGPTSAVSGCTSRCSRAGTTGGCRRWTGGADDTRARRPRPGLRLPRRPPGPLRRRPPRPRGRAGRAARPQRRRQDHAGAPPQRHPHRGRRLGRPSAVSRSRRSTSRRSGVASASSSRTPTTSSSSARSARTWPSGRPTSACAGAELESRVMAALEQVGMAAYADRPPHHLSFGQRRRVAVATVLAMEPEILVLDEPSSNLDPASRRELADILRSLDVTVLMVTHDLPYALELCPRSVVLSDGVVVADGATYDVLTDDALMAAHRLELPFGFDPRAWARCPASRPSRGEPATVDSLPDVSELSSLERDIEETRDRLAGTIDALVYRASPKTIVSREVASVKGYFVAPDGTPRTDNILKVAGVVAGVVAVFVGLRRLTR